MADQESFRNGSSASVHCYQRDGRTRRHTPLRPFVVVWPGTTPAHKRVATALPHLRRSEPGSRPLPEALLLGPHSQSSEYQHC